MDGRRSWRNVDKVFWLIGSGYFYGDTDVGNGGRTGGRKAEFIELAWAELG